MSQVHILASSDSSSEDELPPLQSVLRQRGVSPPKCASVLKPPAVLDLGQSQDSSTSSDSRASTNHEPSVAYGVRPASSLPASNALLEVESAMQAAAPGNGRPAVRRKRARASAVGGGLDLAAAAEGISAKVSRSHAVHWSRQAKGSFAAAEIAVQLESTLAATALGSALTSALQEEKYTVLPPADGVSPGLVQWHRRVQQPDGSMSCHGSDTLQPFLLQVLRGKQLVELVKDGPQGLLEHTHTLRSRLPAGARVLLLAFQVNTQVSALQRKAQAEHSVSTVTRGSIDATLAQAYILADIQTRQCNDNKQAAEYITSLTRAIAEAPYRTRKTALACVAKVRVSKALRAAADGAAASAAGGGSAASAASGAASVRSGSSFAGGGASELTAQDMWCAQLQMIPGVSASKCVLLPVPSASALRRTVCCLYRAVNIVRHYPSFQSLMQVYEDPNKGEADKAALLEVRSCAIPSPCLPSPPSPCRASWTPNANQLSCQTGCSGFSLHWMAMP